MSLPLFAFAVPAPLAAPSSWIGRVYPVAHSAPPRFVFIFFFIFRAWRALQLHKSESRAWSRRRSRRTCRRGMEGRYRVGHAVAGASACAAAMARILCVYSRCPVPCSCHGSFSACSLRLRIVPSLIPTSSAWPSLLLPLVPAPWLLLPALPVPSVLMPALFVPCLHFCLPTVPWTLTPLVPRGKGRERGRGWG